MEPSKIKLFVAVIGIYASFLTWGLVQEPLNTKVWPNSDARFTHSAFVALCQGLMAIVAGWLYLLYNETLYSPWHFIRRQFKDVLGMSVTQTMSAPIATYSLYYVDYLTYTLAKSCKLIPIMLVHLLVYRTPIPREKIIVGFLVSIGVMVFTLGCHTPGIGSSSDVRTDTSIYGILILLSSLFLDGVTNARQDRMLRNQTSIANKKYQITGAHIMFVLNLFIVLWNSVYLLLWDRTQWHMALTQIHYDPVIIKYLLTYSVCGALGQCFIFFTLANYSSIVLTTVTVTRKMVSMLLSIVVYGHSVSLMQWIGIIIIFGGITWEALLKYSNFKTTKERKEQSLPSMKRNKTN